MLHCKTLCSLLRQNQQFKQNKRKQQQINRLYNKNKKLELTSYITTISVVCLFILHTTVSIIKRFLLKEQHDHWNGKKKEQERNKNRDRQAQTE